MKLHRCSDGAPSPWTRVVRRSQREQIYRERRWREHSQRGIQEGGESSGKDGGDGKRVEREGANTRREEWREKSKMERRKKRRRVRTLSCLCFSPQVPSYACSVSTGRAMIRI